jgi:hypothetical protein
VGARGVVSLTPNGVPSRPHVGADPRVCPL